jgi:hypothetical protein
MVPGSDDASGCDAYRQNAHGHGTDCYQSQANDDKTYQADGNGPTATSPTETTPSAMRPTATHRSPVR